MIDRQTHRLTHTRGHRFDMALVLILALLAAGTFNIASAQHIRAAITPDTILVGDVFRAAIRVYLPPGFTLHAPDTLPVSGEIENAGRARQTTRETPDGGTEYTLIYPLSAWRTGAHSLPELPLAIRGPDEIRPAVAAFPSFTVGSVLPADTAGITPQPPKDVLGPNRLLWPWLLGALTIALALVALIYSRRRRPRGPVLEFDVAHAGSPRDRALAALDQVRERGLLEEGRVKEFYSGTIAALRDFLAEYDTAWGIELTSAELLRSSRAALATETANQLARLLDAADQVKFNRRQPATEAALEEWRAARRWVEEFRLRPPHPSATPATTPESTSGSEPPVPGAPAPDPAGPGNQEPPADTALGQGRGALP